MESMYTCCSVLVPDIRKIIIIKDGENCNKTYNIVEANHNGIDCRAVLYFTYTQIKG